MIRSILVGVIALFGSVLYAAPVNIALSEGDQQRLAKELSRIDFEYRSEEVDQSVPYPLVHRYYNYLNVTHAFSIGCHEQFLNHSTIGTRGRCSILFESDLSSEESISVRDGFLPELLIAKIKDSRLAGVLYRTIGNGTSPKVFFTSREEVSLTHPATGQRVRAFRLRIDCERNQEFTVFSCSISAVK